MNPSAPSTSNIKVFPSFQETAFFSGEEFSCILTFKNVAEPSPSSSATSLEGIKNGSRIVNTKFTGAEWMVESGRSVSEGVPGMVAGGRSISHERSMSTTIEKSEEDRARSKTLRRSHGRSQSVVASPTTPNSTKLEPQHSPVKQKKPESIDLLKFQSNFQSPGIVCHHH
jgi:hypothetical protein